MMKYLFFLGTGLISLLQAQTPYKRVNPFIGTGGHGHTYPGAVAPFGMVQLSPDTRLDGWDGCSGYHYDDSVCYGFSHTHLSGTGVSDYGDLLLRPSLEPLSFSHKNEQASPGYYSVQFNNGIFAEMTAGQRVGMHHYRFTTASPKVMVVDLEHRDFVSSGNMDAVSASAGGKSCSRVYGHRFSKAWALDQQLFFDAWFSALADSVRILQKHQGESRRLVLYFPSDTRDLYVAVGISFSGWLRSGPRIQDELSTRADAAAFKSLKQKTQEAWQAQLGKIQVNGTPQEQQIFYTALYHTMIVPNRVDDPDGSYRGMDFKVHEGKGAHYSVFSLWDTYRAAHPLYTLIETERTRDMLRSFLSMYRESGRLPVWELAANETNCMIGYHAVSVIADALAKGILPDEAEALFEAAVASANAKVFGLDDYRRFGYLSTEHEHESVSKTLEYAYDDWCIARMAERLGRDSLRKVFDARSKAWQNLLDPHSGLMRPRNNGGRLVPFEPREVNNHFTEANSWQYSFSVPHDLNHWLLAQEARGGSGEALLDSLFTANSATVGRQQVDITGLIGQYAHGNEPSHHIAYLYNSVGKPHKTQERVRQILNDMYRASPDGLSGNEDCGQMSAWYVLSSLGFYPVCPGDPRYSIGYPLFREATLHFESGRKLKLEKRGEGNYIRSVQLNGRNINRNYLTHAELIAGGNLLFEMSERPGSWGTATEARYLTSVEQPVAAAPVWQVPSMSFQDSMPVLVEASREWPLRLQWEDGKQLDTLLPKSTKGRLVLMMRESTCISAVQLTAPGMPAHSSRTCVYKRPNAWQVKLPNPMNRQYTAGGPQALTDGITGDGEWQKGHWMGIQGQPFVAELDLGKVQNLEHAEIGFLQDTRSWIVFPRGLRLFSSEDGTHWQLQQSWTNLIPAENMSSMRQAAKLEFPKMATRHIRIEAEQYGPLPAWHPGAGGQSFIFADEIRLW